MAEPQEFSREGLRIIAIYQKWLLFCLLIYIVAIISFGVLLEENWGKYRLVILVLQLVATALTSWLAMRIFGTGYGLIVGLLTLIPILGLIVMFIISRKVTNILRSHEIHDS